MIIFMRIPIIIHTDSTNYRGSEMTGDTGIIYIATSKTSLKSYIGKTVNKLNQRRNKHCRTAVNKKSNGYNTHFYNAIRKYGFDDFKWAVLYSDVPIDKLSIMEKWVIAAHDTFCSGYNSTVGGDGCVGYRHNKESLDKMSKPRSIEAKIAYTNSKKYIVIKPDGDKELVINMKKYCIDNGLSPGPMCRVAMGKRRQHKGYRCRYYE